MNPQPLSNVEPSSLLEPRERDLLFEQRLEKAEAMRGAGCDPYANDFAVNTRIAEFIRLYESCDAEALAQVQTVHATAGRVMAINNFGKGAFIRLQDGTADEVARGAGSDAEHHGRLQVHISQQQVGEATFAIFKKMIDVGDFVGVTGTPMRTKTGELTLRAGTLQLLTKALRPLPEKWHGLADVEKRYRQRYLDLTVNSEVRQVFRTRARIIAAIRAFFTARDFLEVETPMMHPVAGGANARPFVTHHNTLDLDLYLRIAPELYLKRLVVGGFDRVFEINRNFRNEGISTFHNPEFTMLEFYQAYATYRELMDLGEALISHVAQQACGCCEVMRDGHKISLAAPFARLTMLEAIAAHGGPEPEVARDPVRAGEVLRELHIDARSMSPGQKVVALFEHFAEGKLIQPTFIYDFPRDVSPLSRTKSADPWFVDRFELFVAGRELANAFSELNDPVDQRARFVEQLRAKEAGDAEAHAMDEDYVRALEHGMPPTAGFGLGIDRLVMLLTGAGSIRDVILFPQLRKSGGG